MRPPGSPAPNNEASDDDQEEEQGHADECLSYPLVLAKRVDAFRRARDAARSGECGQVRHASIVAHERPVSRSGCPAFGGYSPVGGPPGTTVTTAL